MALQLHQPAKRNKLFPNLSKTQTMNAFRLAVLFTLSTLAFSSCKKDSTDKSEINYQVKTVNRSGLVNWTAGTSNGKQIEFKGTLNGKRVEEYILTFDQVDFFKDAGATIKSVELQPGTYTDVDLNYEMTPSRIPALQLKGTFNSSTGPVPITLNLDNYLEIATKTASLTVEPGKNYTATLTLDLAAITSGITQAMLNNATKTNGEIFLSYYSNQSLYSIIINNINNKIHTVDFAQ